MALLFWTSMHVPLSLSQIIGTLRPASPHSISMTTKTAMTVIVRTTTTTRIMATTRPMTWKPADKKSRNCYISCGGKILTGRSCVLGFGIPDIRSLKWEPSMQMQTESTMSYSQHGWLSLTATGVDDTATTIALSALPQL